MMPSAPVFRITMPTPPAAWTTSDFSQRVFTPLSQTYSSSSSSKQLLCLLQEAVASALLSSYITRIWVSVTPTATHNKMLREFIAHKLFPSRTTLHT
jgi:hypothetical protein